MEEFIDMINAEMQLLDDNESEEGRELREELGIQNLTPKELLIFKLDFLAKHMGRKDLYPIEKGNHFLRIVKKCIGFNELKQFFDVSQIACVTQEPEMRIFLVAKDKEDETRYIYTTSDEGEIIRCPQSEIREQFYSLKMKILSKEKSEENKEILLGETEKKKDGYNDCMEDKQTRKGDVEYTTKKTNEDIKNEMSNTQEEVVKDSK